MTVLRQVALVGIYPKVQLRAVTLSPSWKDSGSHLELVSHLVRFFVVLPPKDSSE